MITPQAGYIVDPSNPGGVVKDPGPNPTPEPTGGILPGSVSSNAGKTGFDVFGNPAGVTSPTMKSIYSGLGPSSTLNDAYDAQIKNAKTDANQTIDEGQIRADTLKSFQAEIDAQNSIFADKLARAKVTGANRLGSGTAVQARRGELGSDFGNAATDNINSGNEEIYSGIDNEKQAAISKILTQARTDADKQIADKTAAKTAGLNDYVKYLQEGATRKTTNATTAAQLLLNNKTKVEDLKPEDLTALTTSYGISKNDLLSGYKTAQDAQAKENKANQTILSPGQSIVDGNGKVIATVAPKDTYTVVKGTKTTDAFGNDSVSPDKVFDQTTGKFVGYTPKDSTSDNSGGQPSHTNAPTPSNPKGTSGLSFDQYGLLANTDFKPDDQVDALAQKYLDTYIKNGTVPTASTLGRAIKPGAMAQIDTRARDLYFKATGNPLPTPQILKAQQQIISDNYKMGNNLAIQEGTVASNVDLSLANMTKSGLNSSGFKPLDTLINSVKDAFQDPEVGQMLAQNSTIQNELGSLLAVKNASGTTVYDKLTSAGIIGNNDSPEQIQTKVKALLLEAKNFATALTKATGEAYKFTDPLLQDPNNPARATAKVGALLDKQGIDYEDLKNKMLAEQSKNPGTQPALDATTGAPVFATPKEISSGKYIAL